MKKEVLEVVVEKKEILFESASLYVRNTGKETFYILELVNPGSMKDYGNFIDLDLVIEDFGEKKVIGKVDFVTKERARFLIKGEPFPVTEGERKKYM